jgi:signal transduction histidine kinase/ActR/RegA family two-component response regulator
MASQQNSDAFMKHGNSLVFIGKTWQRICLLLALLLLPVATAYAEPLILTDELASQQESIQLLDYAEIMEDSDGRLSLSAVLSAEGVFQPGTAVDGKLDLNLTPSVYWLRMDIRNQSSKEDWYFTLSGSLSRNVQVYLSVEGGRQPYVQQSLLSHSRSSAYQLSLSANTVHRLYIRVYDRHAPLVIEPRLRSSEQMLTEVMIMYPLYSFVIGGLLTLAVYNLLYFFYLRDKSFLALSIFILGFVLELGNHSGVWYYFSFFRQYLSGVGVSFAFIGIAASISLASNWLEVPEYLPRLSMFFRAAFWTSFLMIPVHLWLGYGTVFAGVLALMLIVLFITATVIRYSQGFYFSFLLRVGILLVLISFIPSLLRGAGLIGDVPVLTDGMYFVLLVALVMLSLTQAEQVRMKSEQAERAATANKAKDEFLTTMSHELRTPMNAVVNAGRLLQQTALTDSQKEYVARLNTSSQHMLSLINDILDLARLDRSLLRMENIPFQLAAILKQVEQLLMEQARSKQLRLALDNHCHLLTKQITGDPTRLKQVLLNLLNNAIKFTPQGEVTLTITPQDVTDKDASLLFEVRDTGIGLSEKQQQKLFQPFSQPDSSTARKYGGSGLGLAISQNLVRCMGGELKVSSKPARGSRFFFTLTFPLQDVAVEEKTVESVPEPSTSLEGIHVLLVDDQEMNRFFGSKLIASLGVKVAVADSGEKTLQLLEKYAFDLVFMDVSMPGMDGYETTQRIRSDSRFVSLPVIALTAHAIVGERERCLAAGMDDYLTKPFEIEQLQIVILRHHCKATSGYNQDKNV